MGAPHDMRTYGMEDGEHCPECSHIWPLVGPAHFIDCHHFSLDDDRDEVSPVRLWVATRATSQVRCTLSPALDGEQPTPASAIHYPIAEVTTRNAHT